MNFFPQHRSDHDTELSFCTGFEFWVLSFLQRIPDVIRGAVLGYGLCAPSNERAIDISFGSQGFSFSLARAFKLVRNAKSFLGYSSYYCQPSAWSLYHSCTLLYGVGQFNYRPPCVWTSGTPSSFRKTMDAVYCLCSFTIMIDIWTVYLSHTASSLPHTGGFHQFWSFLQRLWESNCASAVPSQRDCISLPRRHSEPRSFSSQTGEDMQTCVYVTYLLQHSIGWLHVTCAHEHTNVL